MPSDETPDAKIEKLGKSIVMEIKKGENPSFTTSVRTRSNIFYDKKKGYLKLGDAQEERNFLNVAQSKRFMQTIAISLVSI